MKTKILLMFILFSGLLFSSENISDRVASDFLLRNNSFSKNQHIYPNYMISNIFSKDSNFVRNIKGKDKIMHFSYSALLTYYIYNFSQDIYNNSHQKSINLSISLTGTLGLSKEFSDKYIKKTKFSWYDLGYDFAGICFGLIALNNLR
jgi:uncharacterized protein YfiM (DUF2279 family)